jgi:NodT family efflux transporter outer membrane factor (OMF) lipoprotein
MHLRLAPAALVFLAVVGCTVGPDFVPPVAKTPDGWTAATPKSGKPDSAVVAAEPNDGRWWATFNDPELTSLIERARDANPTLKLAALRIEQARAQLQAVGAKDLPTLGLDSSYARTELSPNGVLGLLGGSSGPATQTAANGFPSTLLPSKLPAFDLFQTGFDASWEIDLFGRVRRQVEAAEAQAQDVKEARNDALVSVYAEVARSYVTLRGVQRLIEITRDNLKAQRNAYNLTHAQAQNGETSNLDVENASAEVATTEAQMPLLEDQKIHLINALSLLIDREPAALQAELDAAAPLPPIPPSVPIGLPSELAHRRPDIRRAEADLHMATANIGVARADLYPRLTLSGSIGVQALRFSNLGDWASKFYNVGPALSIPVFNGNTYANIEVQEVRQKEAALNYETTVLSALHDVENAVSSYESEQVRVHSLQLAATANQHSLDLAQQRYKAGLSSFLDVLDSERRLYASQLDVARSSVTISTNLIAVYKALGGGWGAEDNGVVSPHSDIEPVMSK